MKVILTEVINKLGKIGEIVNVKNGYAKNFLIPKKKAICFTDANFKVFESKKNDYEKLNSNNLETAINVKNKLENKNITIIQNASDDGRLYGSVNSGVIANAINDLIAQKSVSRGEVFLKKPIKEIGVYEVKLAMHCDCELNIKLVVARSQFEAETLINPEKNIAKSQQEEPVNNDEGGERKRTSRRPANKKKEQLSQE